MRVGDRVKVREDCPNCADYLLGEQGVIVEVYSYRDRMLIKFDNYDTRYFSDDELIFLLSNSEDRMQEIFDWIND